MKSNYGVKDEAIDFKVHYNRQNKKFRSIVKGMKCIGGAEYLMGNGGKINVLQMEVVVNLQKIMRKYKED